MDAVLAPLEDPTPDENSIRFTISVETDSGQTKERVLKSPSEATQDDLRRVVEEARALADEAGAPESPKPIDLSDEVESGDQQRAGRGGGGAAARGVIFRGAGAGSGTGSGALIGRGAGLSSGSEQRG